MSVAPTVDALRETHRRLRALGSRAASVLLIRVGSESELLEIDARERAALAKELLLEVERELEELQAWCDDQRSLPAAHPRLGETAPALGDLSFAARIDLQRVTLGLSELTQRKGDRQVLVACERAGRRLLRAVDAVTRVTAEQTGEPMNPPRWEDAVDEALAVRRLYASFMTAIHQIDAAPTSDEERLVRAADALRELLVDATFNEVRLHDKCFFWALERRLQRHHRGHAVVQSAEVWADVLASSSLLSAINRRSVLVAHDQQAIDDAIQCFDAASDAADVAERLQRALGALAGRDLALDRLWNQVGGPPWDETHRQELLNALQRQRVGMAPC